MLETKYNETILPLDLNSVMQLLNSPIGDYTPLAYTMPPATPEGIEVHINICQCDPDSIKIQTSPNKIHLTADATVQFLDTSNSPSPIQLKRDCSQTIPLAPGVDVAKIRSQINENQLVLHIPFVR